MSLATTDLSRNRERWLYLHPTVILRLAVGVSLIATAAVYAGDRVFGMVGTDGVVTAPMVAVRAPIDGRVTLAVAAMGGQAAGGDALFVVEDTRLDERLRTELAARLETVGQSLAGFDTRLAQLRALRSDLDQRIETHRRTTIHRLDQLAREAAAELDGARASLSRWQAEALRFRTLRSGGHASASRAEDAELQVERARAEVRRLETVLERRRSEADAARAGVMIADGQYDTPYARQRLDELIVRIADLEGERTGAAALAAELRDRLAAEDERLGRLRRQAVTSPARGILWNVAVAEGAEVTKGTVLAEIAVCDRPTVEVTLPESRFDAVRVGAPVRVRLYGADQDIPGVVRSVRGAGSVSDVHGKAAAITARSAGLMTVAVAVGSDGGGASLANAIGTGCQVGRTATVRFDEPGSGLLDRFGDGLVRTWHALAGGSVVGKALAAPTDQADP